VTVAVRCLMPASTCMPQVIHGQRYMWLGDYFLCILWPELSWVCFIDHGLQVPTSCMTLPPSGQTW
jgi:hypothetical protein